MLLAVATQMLPLLALVGSYNVQKNAIYHGRAGNGRWPVCAGSREVLESANMANRRDQRPTFEGSRGGDKPKEKQQLCATGQRARRATTPSYCPVSAGGREVLKSANMANRRDQRPTFERSRGVRYQNIANRRDERPTFVKNSRLASTV